MCGGARDGVHSGVRRYNRKRRLDGIAGAFGESGLLFLCALLSPESTKRLNFSVSDDGATRLSQGSDDYTAAALLLLKAKEILFARSRIWAKCRSFASRPLFFSLSLL